MERFVFVRANSAHVAERATLVPQLLECFSGVSESQKPPESSNSSFSWVVEDGVEVVGNGVAVFGTWIWA